MPSYFGRTRSRAYGAVSGSWTHRNFMNGEVDSTGVSTIDPLTTELIHDTCGYPEPHALYLERHTKGYMVGSGAGGSWYSYDALPRDFDTVPNYPALGDENTFATAAAAKTNPGKPTVQLPVFIFELREIPRLIRDTGRTLLGKPPGKGIAGKAGSAYLGWQFGWKPLIKDLTDLVTFASAVEKRKQKLRDLVTKGGYRGKYSLNGGHGATGENSYDIVWSMYPWCKLRITSTTTVKRWAVVHWEPNLPPGILSDDAALTNYARKSVLALHRQQILSNIWEALPWSWLIDYFTNIGNMLEATDNSVAVLSSDTICVMTHRKTIGTPTILEYDNFPGVFDYTLKFSLGATGIRETKERYLASLSPFRSSIPILTDGQLGILSALGAQRFGHR